MRSQVRNRKPGVASKRYHHTRGHDFRANHVNCRWPLIRLLQAKSTPGTTCFSHACISIRINNCCTARCAQSITARNYQFNCIAAQIDRGIRSIVIVGARINCRQCFQQVRGSECARRNPLDRNSCSNSHRSHCGNLFRRSRHSPCLCTDRNEINHCISRDRGFAQHGQANHSSNFIALGTRQHQSLERQSIANDRPSSTVRGNTRVAECERNKRATNSVGAVNNFRWQFDIHAPRHGGTAAFYDCLHRAEAPVAKIDRYL